MQRMQPFVTKELKETIFKVLDAKDISHKEFLRHILFLLRMNDTKEAITQLEEELLNE